MIFGLMAINALEVVAAHVNINSLGWVIEAFIQVTMFDRIASAAAKVTTATVFTAGNSDALCGTQQVNTIQWKTRFTLAVGAGIVVANETINIAFFFEIKIRIVPTITCVAGCTGWPVTLDTDAEVID